MRHLLATPIILAVFAMGMSAKRLKEPVQQPPAFLPCKYETFWYAVEEVESNHNPRAWMRESTGEISAGLYSFSIGDAGRYGCDFKNLEDIYNPEKNRDCKNKVEAKLRKMYPTLSWQLVLGKYWGPLRGPDWGSQQRSTFARFKKIAAKYGCNI